MVQIGGVEDHVHILAQLSPKVAVSRVLQEIKGSSSRWLNETDLLSSKFEWQIGYGAFTVSHSKIETVRRYIQTQKEHHRKQTFQEEYIELLQKHGIEFRIEHLFEDEHLG